MNEISEERIIEQLRYNNFVIGKMNELIPLEKMQVCFTKIVSENIFLINDINK